MDDAQWLDRSTLDVLTFIARRAETESVALVAVARVGFPTPLEEAHLPVLELRRLSAPAAAELLDREAPGLHPVHRARVLAESAGNPLALVELARSASITPTWVGRLSPPPPTLTARLERAFATRLRDVPDATQLCLLAAALDQDLTDFPLQRARTLFSYGRWLRRQRRSADSRQPLRAAVESFDALGATRWSRRARQELRATGETIGPHADARDRLTAQELQIALLAADGLSNRQIAERLVLSHRTIGSHLYRIFPKLGITARSQLRDALAGARPERELVG